MSIYKAIDKINLDPYPDLLIQIQLPRLDMLSRRAPQLEDNWVELDFLLSR